MSQKTLVTLGTDGLSDFVLLSDGTKYMLGSVSPLRFVVETVSGSYACRSALDTFLAKGKAMFTADLDRMWELLKPKRARWSTLADPLIPPSDRTPFARQGTTMADADQWTKEAITNQIARIEGQISTLQQHAKEASPGSISSTMMQSDIQGLRDMVAWLRRPSPYGNQSQNGTYYGLPNQGPGGIKGASDGIKTSGPDRPSYAHFSANTKTAADIIARVEEVDTKIDQLVTAGKKFDAPRAKQDLHTIASKTAEIMQNVDLAQPWVKGDLVELAKQADQIHGLFAGAKV